MPELGIRTVAIFSEGEENALHVQSADESFSLGSGALSRRLNKEKIIEIARKTKAETIHPGYGFLSENADFVRWLKKTTSFLSVQRRSTSN